MTRSSLLGSWIDVAAATAAAETLCDHPAESAAEAAAPPTVATPPLATPPVVTSRLGTSPARWPETGPRDTTRSVPVPLADELADEASTTPPPRLHGRLRALRVKAERNGLVPPLPATVPARPPFAVPLGSLPVRVRALGDWMNESFDPSSLFVADDNGQALVEFRGGADLLAAATVLADAAAKARRHLPGAHDAAIVHLTLGPDQVLSLVTAETALGRWHAGLTTADPLTESAALNLAHALKSAAAGS